MCAWFLAVARIQNITYPLYHISLFNSNTTIVKSRVKWHRYTKILLYCLHTWFTEDCNCNTHNNSVSSILLGLPPKFILLRFPHKNDVRFVFTSSRLWGGGACLIYMIWVCFRIALSTTNGVVVFCWFFLEGGGVRHVSCVPNVVSFSGLFILSLRLSITFIYLVLCCSPILIFTVVVFFVFVLCSMPYVSCLCL